MTDAREIIADAYRDLELNAISPDESAVAITRALYLAGFRILGPDELDHESMERAARIAEDRGLRAKTLDGQRIGHSIATAIRHALATRPGGWT